MNEETGGMKSWLGETAKSPKKICPDFDSYTTNASLDPSGGMMSDFF